MKGMAVPTSIGSRRRREVSKGSMKPMMSGMDQMMAAAKSHGMEVESATVSSDDMGERMHLSLRKAKKGKK